MERELGGLVSEKMWKEVIVRVRYIKNHKRKKQNKNRLRDTKNIEEEKKKKKKKKK